MKYIVNYSNDTAFNIALEEYAFKHLLDEDEIFLLWINKPSIIVGRHQNTIEEINRDYVREHGIEVVRRISGGGAVYHDLNNLNYTIISKESEERAFDFKSGQCVWRPAGRVAGAAPGPGRGCGLVRGRFAPGCADVRARQPAPARGQ